MQSLSMFVIHLSLRLSLALNNLFARSSKDCLNAFFIISVCSLTLIRCLISAISGDWLEIVLTVLVWVVLYLGLHLIEMKIEQGKIWDRVEPKYQPGTIVIVPMILPFLNWKRYLRSIKLWLCLSLVQISFFIGSMISGNYYIAFLALTGFLFFLANAIVSANYFFYHNLNNKSLYSKVKSLLKSKMENRKKVISVVPIPA